MDQVTTGWTKGYVTEGRNARTVMRRASIATDCLALVLATVAAFALRGVIAPWMGLSSMPVSIEWPLIVPFIAIFATFSATGLYERDAYSSRPLQAWTILRATAAALIISSAAAFLIGSGWFNIPRLTIVLAFVLFPLFDVPLRLIGLHVMYTSWVERRRPVAYIVGDSPESRRIAKRLTSLRGFARVRSIDEEGPTRSWADALVWDLGYRDPADLAADSVFIDSSSLSPREAMRVIEASQDRGVDVYVASGLLGPLEGSRLLKSLFHTPVTRVRRTLASEGQDGIRYSHEHLVQKRAPGRC